MEATSYLCVILNSAERVLLVWSQRRYPSRDILVHWDSQFTLLVV
jgi:hypothetical protein